MQKEEALSTQNSKQKAAIYIRVSTEEQARQGFSLSAQEDALKNYCQALSYDIFKIYRDEGKSAKDIKHRPALQQLLKDAENKRFDAIFVYKLDRFSRSLKDLILTIEKLKEQNIDFISLQDKIETASASGKLMFHIISSFAEFERDIISERTRFGMAEKAREGGVITKAPLGYKLVNGQLIMDNEQKDKLLSIFHDFINTNQSLNHLARKNNLTTRGLIKLLKNRTYLGEIKFKENFQGTHDPIIQNDIFEKTQKKLMQMSFQRELAKNYRFIEKVLVQGDARYLDPYFTKTLAYFLAKNAIIVRECNIPQLTEPSKEEIEKISEPQKLAKYLAVQLLKEEGVADNEIFFERNFGDSRPDIAATTNNKNIFVECFSCRVNKVIDYLADNNELWVITSGSYPWDKNPISKPVQFFKFTKGENWDFTFKEYCDKTNKSLENIKNPLDALN